MFINLTTDPYSRLALHLDKTLLGAPEDPALGDILQELFSPEEAALAALLPFSPAQLNDLALDLDFDEALLSAQLRVLAQRGLVYERNHPADAAQYCLLPLVPCMLECQFPKGASGEDKKKLAALFEAYYPPGIGAALAAAAAPYTRVIPVGRSLDNTHDILPFEQAGEVIKAQVTIALANCYCRHGAELIGKGCGAPKDVCLIFGPFALFASEKGFAQIISQEEAFRVLQRAEDAGLVHMTDNVAEGAHFLCNCCGCCCLFLRTITQLQKPGSVSQASYLAQLDMAECADCGACYETCQVGALKNISGHGWVDEELCLGCGQCQGSCFHGAITMVKREYVPPPMNPGELAARLIKGRQKAA